MSDVRSSLAVKRLYTGYNLGDESQTRFDMYNLEVWLYD